MLSALFIDQTCRLILDGRLTTTLGNRLLELEVLRLKLALLIPSNLDLLTCFQLTPLLILGLLIRRELPIQFRLHLLVHSWLDLLQFIKLEPLI